MTNSKSKSKIPLVSLFFVLALIACTAVRYLQYDSVIETDSGFFTHNGGIMNHAYYIFFAASALGFLLTAIVDMKAKRGIRSSLSPVSKSKKKSPKARKAQEKAAARPAHIRQISPVSAVVGVVLTAVCGFFVCLDAVEAVQSMFTAQSTPIMQTATLVLAALGFTFTAYVIFTRRKLMPVVAIAFLFISACFVSAAAMEFMERTYIANLSSRLIILSVNLLLAVFFLSCGRIIAQSETSLTAVSATVFGYSLAVLILSDSAARIAYYYMTDSVTRAQLVSSSNGFELPSPLFLIQAGVVLWIIFALSAKKKSGTKETEKIDENDEIYETEVGGFDEIEIDAFGGDDSV
jgi:hypothetical protein